MIKIAVAGAEGRMGRLIADLIEQDHTTELTARVTRQNSTSLQKSLQDTPVDIFIDFSRAEAVLAHVEACLSQNIAMVIGVTGLSPEQITEIHHIAKNLPIVLSPNMSLGINVSFKLLNFITKILKDKTQKADIAISEIHHRNKKDAPSGTAKQMGEIIAAELDKTLSQAGIQFSSLRLGDVMGDHKVAFAFEGEQLEITHKAEDRIIFAKGAMLAAKWLYNKPPGLYNMQDVLGL